ncbi:hypothetical protein BC938DRAFT_476168 [Jimgerdemannia flammicorona]|uniref:Uncharacterized protein n=1 Tax=Jimgerdemannia flammicorona TaxID=994334 RepID=A0A433QQX2_9FUNG|nr:hypothetical protein BC938DRAFT_476168 [Jimgerdemannia flammicorona]
MAVARKTSSANPDRRTTTLTLRQPFELDYIQTFFTLCDILCEVYHKLLMNTNGGVCTQPFCELVLKIDGRFKKIISLITKELDALARNAIREELETIDPLASMKTGALNFEEWEL